MNIHDISKNTPYFIKKRLQYIKKKRNLLHSDKTNDGQDEINIKYRKTQNTFIYTIKLYFWNIHSFDVSLQKNKETIKETTYEENSINNDVAFHSLFLS